jgi:hypothetical protein
MPIDFARIAQGTMGGFGGILMGAGGAFKTPALGALGRGLSVLSNIPGLMSIKDVYDEYGNRVGS